MPLKPTPKNASKKEKNKVRSENIKTEIKAGKPTKQAIAIAYSKEKEKDKKKK